MEAKFERIEKRFVEVEALRNLDLTIADGTFLVMLGPSGCGKTTALRILAGLEHPSAGSVFIGTKNVTALSARERDVAMVFQSYALYPQMSVCENIAYPLRVRKVKKSQRERIAIDIASRLGIEELLHRRPRELSGGQRQRVALARAIIRHPSIFLMDEPLSNLDAQLRVQMRSELVRLQHELAVTTLYVTHDQSEATTMADVVAVMNRGRIEQLGKPREIYDLPRNRFVATFVGYPTMNIFDVEVADGEVLFDRMNLGIRRRVAMQLASAANDREISLGVRPEDVKIASPGEAGLDCEVALVQLLDDETLVTFQHGQQPIVGRFEAEFEPQVGSRLRVAFRDGRLHAFLRDTGETCCSTRTLEPVSTDRAGAAS